MSGSDEGVLGGVQEWVTRKVEVGGEGDHQKLVVVKHEVERAFDVRLKGQPAPGVGIFVSGPALVAFHEDLGELLEREGLGEARREEADIGTWRDDVENALGLLGQREGGTIDELLREKEQVRTFLRAALGRQGP